MNLGDTPNTSILWQVLRHQENCRSINSYFEITKVPFQEAAVTPAQNVIPPQKGIRITKCYTQSIPSEQVDECKSTHLHRLVCPLPWPSACQTAQNKPCKQEKFGEFLFLPSVNLGTHLQNWHL